jgi:hypothetical protein
MTQIGADSRGFVRVTLRRSAVCLLLLAACDPGEVVLLTPDKSDGGPPALTIHVVVDTPAAELGAALGWETGVPGATVRVHRAEEPYAENYWHVSGTDTTGVALFVDQLPGLYEVEVTRPLTAAEVVQADSTARLLAGGRRISVSPGAQSAVAAIADHRGSLVFSEFFLTEPSHLETGGISYPDAKYFEIYNNSDTTIYLDGKYWGVGWEFLRDYSAWPCAQTAPVRNDSAGVWTREVLRFPGAGADYPVQPGEVALVAKSALDHRPVHPGLYDLSHADFEWGGYRSADNPDVPNLQDIGLRPLRFNNPFYEDPVFLSEPVDLAALPQYTDPHSGSKWVRIPRDAILDVWVSAQDWTTSSYTPGVSLCLEATHKYFERLPGPAFAASDWEEALSIQRRVLYVLPDGRKVLQDTDTSMEDFVKAVRTPGWIPDSLGH